MEEGYEGKAALQERDSHEMSPHFAREQTMIIFLEIQSRDHSHEQTISSDKSCGSREIESAKSSGILSKRSTKRYQSKPPSLYKSLLESSFS
jgi:hypothetical protein